MTQQTFMVVATFKPGVDMGEIGALVPDEVAQVEHLRSQGRLGAVHIAFARGTVFIETFADDPRGARETVLGLPMGKFFELDIFPTDAPPAVQP